MKETDRLLDRMLRTARGNPPPPPEAAPYGFATRLAARWAGARTSPSAFPLWERVFRRAATGMAIAAIIVSVVAWRTWDPVEPDRDLVLESQLIEMLPLP